ncbi:MAG: DUF4874 domain-containing protein [Bacteroidales bacterium]|nr:DUF4874 domain-containing protein [Bacteroidales bacterium]
MKTLKYLVPLAALLLLAGCKEEQQPSNDPPKKELADSELSVNGIPSQTVESGTSLTLTVTTKSDGNLRVKVDKPAFAGLESLGNNEYKLYVLSPKDIDVNVSVTQDATSEYKAGAKDFAIKVKGIGTSALPGPDDAVAGTQVTYTENTAAIVNPERGLYATHEIHSDKETPLGVGEVKSRRTTGHSLLLLEFYLTDYIGSNLSAKYVKNIQANLDALREGGVKAIVRFAYTQDENAAEKDAEVETVLKHVAQLKPTLQKYEDVIFVLQAGFVGVWGEWYYTSHFGFSPKSANDYKPRKQLTDALLDALPSSRQIELRTPTFKMKMYNLALKDTITAVTAHDGSVVSRLAGHNDCFGADKNDRGTFDDDNARQFWMADTRYTIMGGETCAVSDYCLCPQTIKDLEDYHWTYLHDGYNQEVLSRWKTDGCFNEIEQNLGYRFVLQDVHYEAVEAGKPCKVTIRFNNNGYAAPMNPREAWLVWKGSDGKIVRSLLGYDPRTWHSGYNSVVSYFTPSTDKGKLYLELSDPLLPGRADYSIALANTGVFEAKTGYNLLFEVQ